MKYKNIIIVGTSHIAKQSLRKVETALKKYDPEIVALELDRSRLYGLLHKPKEKIGLKDIRRIGIKGWIFSLIGSWAEKKLGEQTGVSPGSEMLTAYKIARKDKKIIVFIDQDISITLRNLSNEITWKEKWHFLVDLFKAFVLRKKEIEFDLSKVPSRNVIKKLTSKVQKRYPNIYRVLVDKRNEFMADRLAELHLQYPENKIVAVMGAGHEKEIIDMIKQRIKSENITYSFTAKMTPK